jgi:hypothetical protein
VGDATASTPIKADLHDINDNDVADGLSNVLTKNGVTQPTADIPLAGHKLINVGQPANPQDAATKKYVDELPGWPTAKNISGSDANGRLNFTSLTGVNGITWSSIDAAWVAKKADSSGQKERDRVVLNNKADCTGSDVVAIDDADGSMQWPGQTEMRQNLVFDGVSYRTPAAGTGGLWRKAASGLSMLANSVATTLAYGVATLETWFNLSYTSGNVALTLNKKASGNQNALSGQMNGVARWIALFGNTTAEVADNSGSDFSLTAYTNAGVAVGPAMIAFRKTAKVQFPQGHQGEFQADAVNTDQVYSDAGLTLGATNLSIYIRPVAYNSTSHQSVFNNLGDLTLDRYLICNGISECAGTGGTPNAGQIFNFDYVDSTHINVYVGTTIVGHITPGASFDARGMIDDLMARVAALEARP